MLQDVRAGKRNFNRVSGGPLPAQPVLDMVRVHKDAAFPPLARRVCQRLRDSGVRIERSAALFGIDAGARVANLIGGLGALMVDRDDSSRILFVRRVGGYFCNAVGEREYTDAYPSDVEQSVPQLPPRRECVTISVRLLCPGRGVIVMAEVVVQDGETLESALRRFKRKVQQEDIIKDIKRHSYYLKPGEKRRAKEALARKRSRKKRSREVE